MTARPGPEAAPVPVPDELAQAEARRPWRKIVVLGIIAGVLLGIVYLSPLREYLGRVRELSLSIRSFGLLAPVVLTLAIAVLVGLGFPRLPLCVLAGMALGFWWGLLWAQVGTLIGNYALFLAARRGAGDWAQRYLARHNKLRSLIHQEGLSGVILARQLPLPGLFINLAFALVSIRHRDFLLGTAIGQLPEAVPCTLIGAGVIQNSFLKSAWVIALAVALAVLVWIGLRRSLQRQQQTAKTTPAGDVSSSGGALNHR